MSHLFQGFTQLLLETKIPVNLNTKISATFLCWELRFCKKKIDSKSELSREKKINSVLFVFKVCLFISTYSSVFCKISVTFPCKLPFCPQQTILVSSANWNTFSVVLILDEKSFTYKRKLSGPKTVPCGTPWFKTSQSENTPLSFTYCLRLARSENSNSFASWEKPYISIFLRKMLCELELNIFAGSRKITTVSLLWSKLAETVSTSSRTASVPDFFLKSELLLVYNFMLINELHHLSQKEALKNFCKTRSYRNWSIICAI